MNPMKRLADSDIGEILLDAITGSVQLRLYNIAIDLDMEEWRDLVGMVQRAAAVSQQEQSLLESHASQDGDPTGLWMSGGLQEITCPACGQVFAAFLGSQGVQCPGCGEPVNTLPHGGRLDG